MPSNKIELTTKQLNAIKKRLRSKYLKAGEAALLEGLLEMATLHPNRRANAAAAWFFIIPPK